MPGIKQIFLNVFNPRKMTIWIILLLIGLAVSGAYVYNSKASTLKGKAVSDVPNSGGASKDVVIYFFYADWCPHCKSAKGPWQKFQANYDKKIINNYKVLCKPVDCSEPGDNPNKPLMDKYDVTGFPTIKVIKNGKVIDFDAKITEASMSQFVDNVVGNEM